MADIISRTMDHFNHKNCQTIVGVVMSLSTITFIVMQGSDESEVVDHEGNLRLVQIVHKVQ